MRRSRDVAEGGTAGPELHHRGPGWIGPVRSFGPARSMAIMLRPSTALACRTCSAMARHAVGSSCAQLIRARFMPR